MANKLSANKKAYLAEMGIPVWREQGSIASEQDIQSHSDFEEKYPPESIKRLDWSELRAAMSSCTACELHKGREQVVFGAGDVTADLMLIGEAPTADEDKLGQPFVGEAGQLLSEMLKAIGFQRQQVFIANPLRCHSVSNRVPQRQHVDACRSFLLRQIELVHPKLILCIGQSAAQMLLQTEEGLTQLRDKPHSIAATEVNCIVTYHPTYLLANPGHKAGAWADLLLAKKIVESMA